MTIERKLLSTSPSDDAPDVAEAFSTHLYTGNGGTNVINNGIDLAGEGGMVWAKCRSATGNHSIFDTERGASKLLYGLGTAAETTSANSLTSFNSNGFTLGADDTDGVNKNTRSHVAWTFRKKKKFFDVVTYSGNGASSRAISHGLNGAVGWMVVKRTSAAEDWTVWHRSLAGTSPFMNLNSTGGSSTAETIWTATEPTSTAFTVGSHNRVNASGHTYVAYLWADNSAEDAEEQMIKCGGYTGTGAAGSADLSINLGWEPQFVIVKNTSGARNWRMFDSMRGVATEVNAAFLTPNSNAAEFDGANFIRFNSLGFELDASSGADVNSNNDSYIYIAIRAPMMIEPKAATDVFYVNASNGNGGGQTFHSTGFDVGMGITKKLTGGVNYISARLTGQQFLRAEGTNVEDNGGPFLFDVSNGVTKTGGGGNGNDPYVTYAWKQAKGFMDVICYIGTGSARTLPHSLGVVPEMMWVRNRTTADSWQVYVAPLGNTKYIYLDENYFAGTNISRWNNTTPTASVITVGATDGVNRNTDKHIAYLFATLAGISKVGSYTGNGSSQTISCGFSAGSRFILIKRTDGTNPAGDWYYWDSARGIVAGNDPHASFNTSAAQVTNDDSVDPHSSGFIVNQVSATNINVSSGTYIFYAIA